MGSSATTHEELDRALLSNAMFIKRSACKPKTLSEQLGEDPYFRFKRVLIEASRVFPIRPGMEWLDLGCHAGQFMSFVKNAFGVRVTGIDNWDLREQWTEEDYDYVRQDLATDWPSGLGERRYECVSCLEVLEHMIDTDRFLDRISQVLVDDGFLLLTTPNINSLRNRLLVPLGHYPAAMEWRNIIHHVRMYNIAALKQQLVSRGFRILSATGVTFLPQRLNRRDSARVVSEWLARKLPTMCGNLIVIAQKKCPIGPL